MRCIIIGTGFVEQHLNISYVRSGYRFEPSSSSVRAFLDAEKPDVVINCIGRTGRPNIDECEVHKPQTVMSNVTIPLLLAEATQRRGIRLLHVGSGCIFSGPSPDPNGWREIDFANPKSFYSKTKYSCDLAISDFDNVTTLRIRMPVSDRYLERNFITKILGYQKIIDIQNSMTFMGDFTKVVDWVIDNSKTGVYHVTNPGTVTAADFARAYQKLTPHQFQIINEAELDRLTVAKRSNCIINSSKIINEGFQLSSAQELIESYVLKYHNSRKLENS